MENVSSSIPYTQLGNINVNKESIRLISAMTIRKYQVLPIDHNDSTITIVMAEPINHQALNDIKMSTGLEVIPLIGEAEEIDSVIKRSLPFSYDTAIEKAVNQFRFEDESLSMRNRPKHESEEDAPIIKLVNHLLNQAVESGCSDIHIEPASDGVRIRFRQDGELSSAFNLPKKLLPNLISRLKILANLDITDKRIPQDGRFQMTYLNRLVDFRLSTMPVYGGEKASIRILDKEAALFPIDHLGLSSNNLAKLTSLCSFPRGMVVVTGPTGSGKTSLLYSMLNILNSTCRNLITLEDPVEYCLPGVNQTQVNPKVGLSFANGLSHILRQDPDVIMVGEIRDRETANISVQAALTGHLLLTTLHTNSAVGTIARLMDMGIEKYLLSSALAGIISQRLVKQLCPHCRREMILDQHDAFRLGVSNKAGFTFFRREGCRMCRGSGYLGRIAIQEIIVLGPKLKSALYLGRSEDEMQAVAIEEGMIPILDDGLLKASQGLTSLEEVIRTAAGDEYHELF